MNSTPELTTDLRQVLEHSSGSVVDLVDHLLSVCQERGLQLDWRLGVCRVSAGGQEEKVETRLQKPVFRAVLARLAALCNELRPNSVSPYRGEGKASTRACPGALFRVEFANTQDEQWLKLKPLTVGDLLSKVENLEEQNAGLVAQVEDLRQHVERLDVLLATPRE
jgi:hypothetical protein